MKSKTYRIIDITIETINYIIISYALSSIALCFRNQWLYILFFSSDIWLFSKYFNTVKNISESKIATYVMSLASLITVFVIMYIFGYVE